MRVLLLGRKHIAKSEDIVRALGRLGHWTDFVLFPSFHYASENDSYKTSVGLFLSRRFRSKKTYYLGHFFRLLFLLVSHFRRNRYDTLFAIDWFECVVLFAYKSFFARNARLIFYSYDFYFFDSVFSSRYIINRIDRFIAKRADEVWNVNDAIRIEREKQGAFMRKNKTVPLGIEDKSGSWNPHYFGSLLFVGNLKSAHGLDHFIGLFSELARRRGDLSLTIVGCGNESERLRRKISEEGLERQVFLRGFVEESVLLEEIRSGKYVCGVALYEKSREIACVDPGKVKDYLSWGLPVLMTATNAIANDIRAYKLGVVIDSDADMQLAVDSMTNETLTQWQKNVRKYVSEHSFESVVSRNLVEVRK